MWFIFTESVNKDGLLNSNQEIQASTHICFLYSSLHILIYKPDYAHSNWDTKSKSMTLQSF